MIVSSDDKKNQKTKIKKTPSREEISQAVDNINILSSQPGDQGTNNLRPRSLDNYIGQTKVTRQLQLILESAKIREALPEHILLYGQAGLGKTTLAELIAKELKVNFRVVSAPGLQKIGDIVSLMVNLEPDTVLFIDEIHRLKLPLEEALYTALEDRRVDLVIGKGQGLTTTSITLEPFTVIGATTQLGKISKPLKDRFPTVFRLEQYNDSEIIELIQQNCHLLKLKIDDRAIKLICNRSRGTPRIANNLLKRILDLKIVKKLKTVDYDTAEDLLSEMGVFENGLTKTDLSYLQNLLDGGKGLKTIAGVLSEDSETLEQVVEPYLIYLGYIAKDSSGRQLTVKGRKFIEKPDLFSAR